MINMRGAQEVHLFDCYADRTTFVAKQYALYHTVPRFHPVCIGPEEMVKDAEQPSDFGKASSRRQLQYTTLDKAIDWGAQLDLGVALKLDIDGSEWAALTQLPSLKFLTEKVVLIDLEAHFCMARHGLSGRSNREAIITVLKWFNRHFHIAGRRVDDFDASAEITTPEKFKNAGCGDGHYQTMAVSYYSKRLGHGRARPGAWWPLRTGKNAHSADIISGVTLDGRRIGPEHEGTL